MRFSNLLNFCSGFFFCKIKDLFLEVVVGMVTLTAKLLLFMKKLDKKAAGKEDDN